MICDATLPSGDEVDGDGDGDGGQGTLTLYGDELCLARLFRPGDLLGLLCAAARPGEAGDAAADGAAQLSLRADSHLFVVLAGGGGLGGDGAAVPQRLAPGGFPTQACLLKGDKEERGD